jgi:hypothetical protein
MEPLPSRNALLPTLIGMECHLCYFQHQYYDGRRGCSAERGFDSDAPLKTSNNYYSNRQKSIETCQQVINWLLTACYNRVTNSRLSNLQWHGDRLIDGMVEGSPTSTQPEYVRAYKSLLFVLNPVPVASATR